MSGGQLLPGEYCELTEALESANLTGEIQLTRVELTAEQFQQSLAVSGLSYSYSIGKAQLTNGLWAGVSLADAA